MTLRVLHFAEDALSAAISRDLLDRVVAERGPDWLRELFADAETRATQRRFEDLRGADGWASRGAVKSYAEANGVRSFKRLSGNAALAAKCLLVAAKLDASCLVLLSFDRDRHPAEESVRHGVASTPGAPRCVVAEAFPEFDVWVLAGWRAEHRAEEVALREAEEAMHAQGAKFSPLAELHRLTSNVQGDARDAKRLCAVLCGLASTDQVGPEHERARRCWAESSIEALEARGGDIGLREYIGEVERVVIVALGGAPPAAPRG